MLSVDSPLDFPSHLRQGQLEACVFNDIASNFISKYAPIWENTHCKGAVVICQSADSDVYACMRVRNLTCMRVRNLIIHDI